MPGAAVFLIGGVSRGFSLIISLSGRSSAVWRYFSMMRSKSWIFKISAAAMMSFRSGSELRKNKEHLKFFAIYSLLFHILSHTWIPYIHNKAKNKQQMRNHFVGIDGFSQPERLCAIAFEFCEKKNKRFFDVKERFLLQFLL